MAPTTPEIVDLVFTARIFSMRDQSDMVFSDAEENDDDDIFNDMQVVDEIGPTDEVVVSSPSGATPGAAEAESPHAGYIEGVRVHRGDWRSTAPQYYVDNC